MNLLTHQIFEQQAKATPDAIAVIFEQDEWTYRQLDSFANRVAGRLRLLSVGADVPVGLLLDRSFELVAGMLGILKAGGAYLPLDPLYPKERLGFMLENAKASVLLTQQKYALMMPGGSRTNVYLDSDDFSRFAEEDLAPVATIDSLIYVIYTSGSTGKPKGVAMTHRSSANLICWQLGHSSMGLGDRTLQSASPSFDVSFQEIFSTLCSGGTLVLMDHELRREPKRLLDLLETRKINRLFTSSVVLNQLAEVARNRTGLSLSLKEVFTAGEQLRITENIVHWFEKLPGCSLHNQYGPTESHVVVTDLTLSGAAAQWPTLPPIGRAIAKATIHLLDSGMHPVRHGETGEICIGGDSLARGYLGRPDLTAERFVPDPFSFEPGARLYKTGDLARMLPDGNIEFLGRTDFQVKIRGNRVELGEIEAVLETHPAVRSCVVNPQVDSHGDKRLLGYLIPRSVQRPANRELREYLDARLPEFMIPSGFVWIDTFPLTPNGKVDRLALPAPDHHRPDLEIRYERPANPTEEALAGIWSDLLRVDRVGVHDNFFELGGDSLIAVRAQLMTETRLGKAFSVAQLFQNPTIRALARCLEDQATASARVSHVLFSKPQDGKPILFILNQLSASKRLAGHLEPHCSVCGIESPIAEELRLWHDQRRVNLSLEELATRCVSIIKQVQPSGPYCLAGWCFGGVLAFEIGRQLTRLGEGIELLVLIDAMYGPGCKRVSAPGLHRWSYHAKKVFGVGPSYVFGKVKSRLAVAKRRAMQLKEARTGREKWNFEAKLPKAAFQGQLLARYRGGVLKCDCVLFRTVREPISFTHDPGTTNGWGGVVDGKIFIEEIKCGHLDIGEEPHVAVVAQKLRHFVARP